MSWFVANGAPVKVKVKVKEVYSELLPTLATIVANNNYLRIRV